jgi:hypothetical protein
MLLLRIIPILKLGQLLLEGLLDLLHGGGGLKLYLRWHAVAVVVVIVSTVANAVAAVLVLIVVVVYDELLHYRYILY